MPRRAPLCLLLTLFLLGCPETQELPKLETLDDCQAKADAALAEAKDARAKKKPKEAEKAAERADDAAEQAESMLPKLEVGAKESPEDEAKRKQAGKVRSAARNARRAADAAQEEKKLAKKLDGLWARGYRKAIGFSLKVVFTGLSKAAQEADGKDLDTLNPEVQESALMAADLASELTGREKLPDGSPDWKGIAADMQALSTKPGPRTHLVLAVAFVVPPLSRDDFALFEIEAIDRSQLKTDEEVAAYLTLRGIVYRMNGFPTLAAEQLNEGAKVGDTVLGPELLGGVHLMLAAYYLREKDYQQADEQITSSLRVWPNNPMAIYFTGEKQAANGDFKKAEASFEDAMKGTDAEWLSVEIGKRARDVRDGKSDDEALFHDLGFLRKVIQHYIWEAAKTSKPAAKVKQTIERGKGFAQRAYEDLKGRIPGLGKKGE